MALQMRPYAHCLTLFYVHILIKGVIQSSCRMEMSSRLIVWQQLAESCGLITVQQGVQQVWRLLLLCLVCRLCFRLGELDRKACLNLEHLVVASGFSPQ